MLAMKPSDYVSYNCYKKKIRKTDFKEVEVGIRSTDELGKDCAKLTKIKKHCGAPSLFRIALIGSRGSGCTTLAKYLSERFNLVHSKVEFLAGRYFIRELFANNYHLFQSITITSSNRHACSKILWDI